MDGQFYQIRELSDKNGWELVEARTLNHHWYVEQWLIRSTWSPNDCYVFFNFETDPMSFNRSEKPVAGILIASLQRPVYRMGESELQFEKNEVFEDRAYLNLGRRSEKQLPEFFKDLANMRQKFYNFYN